MNFIFLLGFCSPIATCLELLQLRGLWEFSLRKNTLSLDLQAGVRLWKGLRTGGGEHWGEGEKWERRGVRAFTQCVKSVFPVISCACLTK